MPGRAMMRVLPKMVYYACIAKGAVILAEYCDGAPELSVVALKCLQSVPPYHRRFSHTAKRRMFNCLIEDPFVYCAIVDEALGKERTYSFLEQVRDEFTRMQNDRDLPSDMEAHSLDKIFIPIFRQVVASLIGLPHKDSMQEGSTSIQEAPVDFELCAVKEPKTKKKASDLFVDWLSRNKQKQKKAKNQVEGVEESMVDINGKATDQEQTFEIVVDGSSQLFQDPQTTNVDSKGQQHAQRMWWHNVRLVLMLDFVVCAFLFGIWLGVCRGVSCIKS